MMIETMTRDGERMMRVAITEADKKVTVAIRSATGDYGAAWKALGPMERDGEIAVERYPDKLVAVAKRSARDNLRAAAEKLGASAPAPSADTPRRSLVRAGTKEVGDTVGGHPVTGLGREWVLKSEDNSVFGADPAERVRVQYAYHR